MTAHAPATPAWFVLTGRILEILFGVAGLVFLMVMAYRRETIPVPVGTVLPFPWVTISVGVGAVLPWTMGRAFARDILSGVIARVPVVSRLTRAQPASPPQDGAS